MASTLVDECGPHRTVFFLPRSCLNPALKQERRIFQTHIPQRLTAKISLPYSSPPFTATPGRYVSCSVPLSKENGSQEGTLPLRTSTNDGLRPGNLIQRETKPHSLSTIRVSDGEWVYFPSFFPNTLNTMTALPFSLFRRLNQWSLTGLLLAACLVLGPGPATAQDSNTEQLKKQLQKSYQAAAQAGNEGDYETAASNFEEAIQYAQELELDDIVQKIRGNLISSLKSAGTADLKSENYEEALSHFEAALEYDDADPSVHYNRGLALLNMEGRTEDGLEALQRAIELGNETGNTRVANLATERTRGEFHNIASEALNAENPTSAQIDEALSAIDELEQYVDPNAQSLFYRARALFEAGDYQQALQTARQGLNMHQGSRSDAAKYYFIVGESQMRLGNETDACQTFKNAAYGDYRARAEHYLENECSS